MEILIFKSFSKRSNSTKQPLDSDGESVQVRLKEETSKYSPIFIISRANASTDDNYVDYIKWGARYYYVSDIVFINNLDVELHCTFDALATLKNEINNTTAFILYSSSNYDSDIPDTRLSTEKEASISINTSASLGSGDYYSIVHAGNDGYPLVGMSWTNMHLLTSKLYDDGFIDGFIFGANPLDYTSRMFNNVSDCINSIIELPYEPAHSATGVDVQLGKYETHLHADILGGLPDVRSVTVNIPWQFNDFRNRSQYTSLLIYLPGYGLADLNADDYIGKTSVNINYTMNPADGTIEYLIDSRVKYTASCGIKVPYGYSSAGSLQSIAGGTVATIGAIAASNTFDAISKGFNTVFSNMSRSSGSTGGSGVGFKNKSTISVITISHNTNVDPSTLATNYGRPLNAVRKINGLSGYVQTANASVDSPYPQEYIDIVNNALNGGVYIE